MSFPYKKNIEKSMKKFYDSLCEKNKRRYVAIESEKLSHGGVNSISALLECDPKTIRQGKKELTELELDIQARHATSRNSGTPVAVIRSPTQRTGDAPAALRPPQTEHKAAQSWLPQMALRLFGIKF